MKYRNRREFLHNSALLLTGAIAGSSFHFKENKLLLSFSTLGCPDWSFEKIMDFAVAHSYQGIELRGILRQMDLTKCKEFSTAKNRKAAVKLMEDKGLHFINLGSSATLHFAGEVERQKNLDEGRRFIDLAAEIDCPFIRVFPNNFPPGQERNKTIDLIIKGLLELADHAKGTPVTVLMETHGDLVKSDDLLTIMSTAENEHTGLVWDISNMWTVTKEPPAEVYKKLKKFIRHTHIKDEKIVEGKSQYTLPGQGEVPIFSAIDELIKNHYRGYYSFEWEKLWHPEIASPEIALAEYPKVMRKHFKNG